MVVIMFAHDAERATVNCFGLVGRLFVRIGVGGFVSDL